MTSYGTITPPQRSPSFSRYQMSRGILKTAETSSPMHVHGQGALSNLLAGHGSFGSHARDERRNSIDQGGDEEQGPGEAPTRRSVDMDERRFSAVFNTPQMRSMRLIGKSNPRYQWEKYWKTEDQLKTMKKPM